MTTWFETLQERFGMQLRISTEDGPEKPSDRSGPKSPVSTTASSSEFSSSLVHSPSGVSDDLAREIRQIDDFRTVYTVGREVMPSTNRGMSINFATRQSDGEEVVLKLRAKPQCFRTQEEEADWRQRTEYWMNIPDNRHIAKIHEVLEDPNTFCIVMEKVSGMDLSETLEEDERMPVTVAREILRQLLVATIHMHSHNAVHKDLKLENVMVQAVRDAGGVRGMRSNSLKVIDFDTLDHWEPTSPSAKVVVGTDQYISQEAYAGNYSPMSDIFAIGVIAYRLLSGKFPFRDEIFDDEAGENWVGSPKMAQIRRRLKVAKVDFSARVWREEPEALDLVKRMLWFEETLRPTAGAALEHPWFQNAFALQDDDAGTEKYLVSI